MKTLKNPNVLAEEMKRFGEEEYVMYSPKRKKTFIDSSNESSLFETTDSSEFSIDKLRIKDQIDKVSVTAGVDIFRDIELFINES